MIQKNVIWLRSIFYGHFVAVFLFQGAGVICGVVKKLEIPFSVVKKISVVKK
jgi:hypothetical protein